MIEHYFGGYKGVMMTPSQTAALTKAWEAVSEVTHLTPAQLEQFCAEYDTVEALFTGLEAMVQL
jgi:hypothetical protein